MVKNKSKSISIIIYLLLVIATISACKKEPDFLDSEYCWEQVGEYTIYGEDNQESKTITLTAPDYVQLIQQILQENNEATVTNSALMGAIEEFPDLIKEYSFTVEKTDEETIKNVFFDQIAKELAVAAISRIDYTEEWGIGE